MDGFLICIFDFLILVNWVWLIMAPVEQLV